MLPLCTPSWRWPPSNLRLLPRPPPLITSIKPQRCSSNGDSYLDMWKKAVERRRKTEELGLPPLLSSVERGESTEEEKAKEKKKVELFNDILQVPKEERDRIQRLQVIDRAAAAIAAARALLKESPLPEDSVGELSGDVQHLPAGGLDGGNPISHQPITTKHVSPGPDFWSWSPPPESRSLRDDVLPTAKELNQYQHLSSSLLEKEQSADILALPFESTFSDSIHSPPLPPLQSLIEFEKIEREASIPGPVTKEEVEKLGSVFLRHATEAADALVKSEEASSSGLNPDGSKWWRETGVEKRPDGVVCKWTLIRGVNADATVEWENKFWEASDHFDYKELGSEKSGRDAAGNVWHESWKESMWQDLRSGLMHIEKTADKWGKNADGGEWQEKWWEHYDASGQTEKWAHKWCCIDPHTPLAAGHAHVWHERWGEKYDGQGGSTKYTDKWAERSEDDGGRSRWGDKWDERFDPNGHGVKQGETWWEGRQGERWNRTWGEQHNGTGWVHKYGKSSCGEHWDTHVHQDTWYERIPHFGFEHCLENSVQLRRVRKQTKGF
ncbi:uncharacterized protein M6B38_381900 [Iris pallida]|uniref:Uncharacterized protein n=1 Tax=Iris pallida TaxID=29817 RepID=A0AAX6G7C5_IRIPA|nr:uncharacterized protein M6B38_381900 [Iris pallida]